MRRTAITVIACLAAFAATVAPAFAATNGMLAAVADGKLVTVNPDGSGLRTLPGVPTTSEISGLAWSPDGNRIAFSQAGRIYVYDLPKSQLGVIPNTGPNDISPAWSPNGAQITYLHTGTLLRETVTVNLDGSAPRRTSLNPLTVDLAWAPNSTPDVLNLAWTIGQSLFVTGMGLELRTGVVGAPAWSPDSKRLTYVTEDTGLDGAGLFTDGVGNGGSRLRVTGLPASSPRWSPDMSSLVYLVPGGVRTVAAAAASTPVVVPGLANVISVDWQPCSAGAYADCVSYSPPSCRPGALQALTQSDQAVNLPVPECTIPGSLSPRYVATGAQHGTVDGLTYTPHPGFIGEDAVNVKAVTDFGESEPVTVRIFVVKRAASQPPGTTGPTPAVKGAPYLTARATPRLDRKRTTLVKLACDQSCSFEVRLTGALKKPKKTVRGTAVKRSLAAGQVLSLRLKLPLKPKGTFKSMFVTGTVVNAAGEKRAVKLPVRLPR